MEPQCNQCGPSESQAFHQPSGLKDAIQANFEACMAVIEKMNELNGKMSLLMAWGKGLDLENQDSKREFHGRAALVVQQVRDIWPFWKQAAVSIGVDARLIERLEANLAFLGRNLRKGPSCCH